MNIALDTNVIVYALAGVPQTAAQASRALEEAAADGGIFVLAAPVYAELLAIPGMGSNELDAFLAEAKIRVDWQISRECWTVAGAAFAAYAVRRKRQKLIAPRRILADFLIGSHALDVGGIFTADASFYRTNFPHLRVQQF